MRQVPSFSLETFVPASDETPFFCLLEDDRLITKLSVETDWLLTPHAGSLDAHMVHLVMTVSLRPSVVTPINLNFV